jgi:hypothetical protein
VLLYGLLRLVDGWDGHRGPWLAWDLGHTLFFVAFVHSGTGLLVEDRRVENVVRRHGNLSADCGERLAV